MFSGLETRYIIRHGARASFATNAELQLNLMQQCITVSKGANGRCDGKQGMSLGSIESDHYEDSGALEI